MVVLIFFLIYLIVTDQKKYAQPAKQNAAQEYGLRKKEIKAPQGKVIRVCGLVDYAIHIPHITNESPSSNSDNTKLQNDCTG